MTYTNVPLEIAWFIFKLEITTRNAVLVSMRFTIKEGKSLSTGLYLEPTEIAHTIEVWEQLVVLFYENERRILSIDKSTL